MANYQIGNPEEQAHRTELMLMRSGAIEAYAALEQSLNGLLAHLLGTTYDIAGIIFFRIVNSHSRNIILEELFRKYYKEQYSDYWNSFLKFIRPLDQERNEIVHWYTIIEVGSADESITVSAKLIPPNFWNFRPETKSHTIKTLQDFSAKCDFASRFINMFMLSTSGRL